MFLSAGYFNLSGFDFRVLSFSYRARIDASIFKVKLYLILNNFKHKVYV